MLVFAAHQTFGELRHFIPNTTLTDIAMTWLSKPGDWLRDTLLGLVCDAPCKGGAVLRFLLDVPCLDEWTCFEPTM